MFFVSCATLSWPQRLPFSEISPFPFDFPMLLIWFIFVTTWYLFFYFMLASLCTLLLFAFSWFIKRFMSPAEFLYFHYLNIFEILVTFSISTQRLQKGLEILRCWMSIVQIKSAKITIIKSQQWWRMLFSQICSS